MDRIKEYFASPRVSNSMLGMMQNPRLVKLKKENPELEDNDKKHLRIGSAVDCLLTSPERFDRDFKVLDVNRPYGLLGKFVIKLPPGLDYNSPVELYEEAYVHAGYKMNIEYAIRRFWESEDAVNFYNASINTPKGVIILSKEEMSTSEKCVELIGINPDTRRYFVSEDPDEELFHQVPIYFEYQGVECKALLDGILVNHKERYVQPFDLKTIGKSVYEFPQSFLQGYYRQAAFYQEAVWMANSPVEKYLTEEPVGYTLRNFIFIVVETGAYAQYHPAVIYQTSKKDLRVGLEGGTINGKIVHGVNKLLDDYKWHTSNNYWDMPRELFENKSTLKLDVFD